MFLPSRERVPRKPTLAFGRHPRYTPADAQEPRHSPHHNRDAYPNHRDALAFGDASLRARGQRQVGALHSLRRTGLPAGPHTSLWLDARLHWRERIWGIIELIQPSFNRSADVNDWVADIVGVVLGVGCGLLYRRLRMR